MTRGVLGRQSIPTPTSSVPTVPVSAAPAGPASITTTLPSEALLLPGRTSPINTTLPVIVGIAAKGQVLDASGGSWTESPSLYTYQWQGCDALGGECSNVSGATASTYELGSSDVGHTVRVVVTATGSSGAGTATSKQTAVIVEAHNKQIDCFGKEEACGYPGPVNTGVERGVVLASHAGSVVIQEGEAGAKIKDEKIEGNLEISADNVTVENVEVIAYSQKGICEGGKGAEGGGAVQIRAHGAGEAEISTGIVLRHVTVHGVTPGCPTSLSEGISMREASSAADVKVEWSKIYWVGKCFFQSATWENDYCDVNGELPGAHYDGIFDNGEGTTAANPGLVIRHDTILMPHWQTAPLFLSGEKEVGEERIEDNFLAGGGYLMYLPGASASTVKGPVVVAGNRFARCLGVAVSATTGGHRLCAELGEEDEATSAPLTSDGHGLFPGGGSYGVLYSAYDTATDHLSGDYWDDNFEAAP